MNTNYTDTIVHSPKPATCQPHSDEKMTVFSELTACCMHPCHVHMTKR